MISDKAGNLYGTTTSGGKYNSGTVFELALSSGSWKESVLYNFTGGNDGGFPYDAPVMDKMAICSGRPSTAASTAMELCFSFLRLPAPGPKPFFTPSPPEVMALFPSPACSSTKRLSWAPPRKADRIRPALSFL